MSGDAESSPTYYFSHSMVAFLETLLKQTIRNCKSSCLEELEPDTKFDSYVTSTVAQILERVKPDRVTITKPEEDRRRRTIIVEKKNGTYGFTLQSYGIHYRKEQEIEMITYVDHVDYDGPAFRAGMREGDVILSINGHDVEKVDHKGLVRFIKSCDSRMRMVVLFEDCVRKVELHMRYIKLQSALKSKTMEMERLCLKEKELLTGKWKTHSLPARKKNTSAKVAEYGSKVHTDNEEEQISRSALSSEDVAAVHHHHYRNQQPRNHHHHHHHHQNYVITYPPYYIDSRGRAYYLHPSRPTTPSSSKEYLVTMSNNWTSKLHISSNQNLSHYAKNNQCRGSSFVIDDGKRSNTKGNLKNDVSSDLKNAPSKSCSNISRSDSKKEKTARSRSYHQHICGGCLKGDSKGNDKDNCSMEAYDVVDGNPCCDSECVPGRRRRSRSQNQKLKSSSSKTSLSSNSANPVEGHSNRSIQVNITTSFTGSGFARRHHQGHHYIMSNLPSYRNLLSEASLHSCTSSELPTSATLYGVADQSAISYTTSLSSDTLYWDQPGSVQSVRKTPPTVTSIKPVKSCDDLAKGHAPEYLDRDAKCYSSKNISRIPSSERYFDPNKSSESLFYSQNLSESGFSCEYLSHDNPTFISNEEGRFVPIMPSDLTGERDKAIQTDSNKRLVDVPQKPEVTRL